MATTKPKVWDKNGRGRRQCPHCEKYVSVAAPKCANCGQVLKRNTKPKPKSATDLIDCVQAVQELGGLEKMKELIADCEENLHILSALGTLEEAKRIVGALDTIKSKL